MIIIGNRDAGAEPRRGEHRQSDVLNSGPRDGDASVERKPQQHVEFGTYADDRRRRAAARGPRR